MTIEEMHIDFKLKLNKLDTKYRQDLNPAIIDWLLNEGQRIFINQRYSINNNHRAGFENNQKRIDDLSSIHIQYPVQPDIDLIQHEANYYELPISKLDYPYHHLTRLSVYGTNLECEQDEWVTARIIQTDDISDALRNPFIIKDDSNVIANFGKSSVDNSFSIYFNTLAHRQLTKARISYLKIPVKMGLGGYNYVDDSVVVRTDCELNESVHGEIVDTAVDIAAGIIESPSYQNITQTKLNKEE